GSLHRREPGGWSRSGTHRRQASTDEGVGQVAGHTSASISIEADPATIMGVIADFEAYPTWATAVKAAEVLETHPDGRASKVHFELNAGVLKDRYTLAYTWDRDREVRWTLAEGQVVKALDGAYTL